MAGRLLPMAGSVLVVLVAGCGSPSGATTTAAASGSPSTTTATTSPTASASATTAAPSTLIAPRTVTAQALPGDEVEYGPAAGRALAVMGVAADASLPLQDLPGPDGHALSTLPPLTTEVIATGRARMIDPPAATARATVWAEVTVRGVTGWADAAHLAAPAHTTDLTAEVVDRMGRRPVAETMLDLGRAVAQVYVSEEPPSTVTVSVAPTVGDLGEITVDVVGFGDDSVAGQRLHVFATPGDESFTLRSVEATPFCYRGVTAAGLCI